MKIFLIYIILIFGQTCFAQKFSNNLFVEIGANQKVGYARKYNLAPNLQNQYYTISQNQFSYSGSLLLNFSLGYRFSNKNEIVLGIMQDEALISRIAVIPNVTTFTPGVLTGNAVMKGYSSGASSKNINITYKNLVIKHYSNSFKKDNYIGIQFNLGICYIYKPNNGIENLSGIDGLTVTAPDSNKVSVIFTTYNIPVEFKRSFKLNTGLTFLFGKSEKESFTFTISYITGRPDSFSSNYTVTNVETIVTNNNGTKELFKSGTTFRGRGNGLYFTLSKKIFPFKLINDKRLKKLNKLKEKQNA
ncbi:MAG: hypothetical protein ACK5QC_02920 [Bacteroidota bacterium]